MSKKNNDKKGTSGRKTEVAKAGRRAGSTHVPTPTVHMGKANWIVDRTLHHNLMIADAVSVVKANAPTEEMARQILRAYHTPVVVEIPEVDTTDLSMMEKATVIAKSRMSNWSN